MTFHVVVSDVSCCQKVLLRDVGGGCLGFCVRDEVNTQNEPSSSSTPCVCGIVWVQKWCVGIDFAPFFVCGDGCVVVVEILL